MPIPRITPYRMPTAAQLPGSTAGWRPDPERSVLLVHDMQRYFVDFLPAGRSPTTALLGNIARTRRVAVDRGMPVVYTAQPGRMSRADRGLLHDLWGPGMADDGRSRAIVPELAPAPGDLMITKSRYSAFHRTPLVAELARMGRDQLVICGVYAHIGCLLTAADAFAHDIQAFVIADAVADFGLREHLMALEYAAGRCAVTMTVDQWVRAQLSNVPLSSSGPDCGE